MTIQIPIGLRNDLAETTSYDTKLQNQAKKNENDQLQVRNEESQKLIQLQRDNARELETLVAAKNRALIIRDEQRVTKESDAQVKMTNANEQISVLLNTVNGEKQVAENTAKKHVNEMINAEATKMSAKKIEIDQWSIIQENKAKTSYETSSRYEAMLLEA